MEKTFKVEGMSCGHCVNAVESALKSVEGVEDVSVHLAENEVIVSYSENVSEKEMVEAIEEQGYDVV
ncbi:copper ion binding protein [Halobacillus yeomjeoni]|uniref:Heavy-metal-associated domain-containing protein n=1 Tax=Halobacillus yeomjeoni TaxID=311194 RepID=A0A931MU66_9BACI|nr:copper ion binding protein [Halobacillus yeomjeoni]MBH0229170.1 heavy-metal-associated domain-containing protein [Halobacillus yeomjeoni]